MSHEPRLGTWEPLSPATPDRRTSIGVRISRMNTFIPPDPHETREGTEEDLNDPNIERFPTTREGILRRIQTMKEELPEDVFCQPNEDLTEASRRGLGLAHIDWTAAYPGVDGHSFKSRFP